MNSACRESGDVLGTNVDAGRYPQSHQSVYKPGEDGRKQNRAD